MSTPPTTRLNASETPSSWQNRVGTVLESAGQELTGRAEPFGRSAHSLCAATVAEMHTVHPWAADILEPIPPFARTDAAVTVAAACELLRASHLLRMQVITRGDGSTGGVLASYRRAAVAAGMGSEVARHHGITASVIAGDLLLNAATLLIHRDPEQSSVTRTLFNAGVQELAACQLAIALGDEPEMLGSGLLPQFLAQLRAYLIAAGSGQRPGPDDS